jgi:hypothetical protein
LQSFCCFLSQCCTVEVEFPDLFKPALQLVQVSIFLFELGLGEFVDRDFLDDFGFEIGTASKKFAILLVTIRLEAGDNLISLATVGASA